MGAVHWVVGVGRVLVGSGRGPTLSGTRVAQGEDRCGCG